MKCDTCGRETDTIYEVKGWANTLNECPTCFGEECPTCQGDEYVDLFDADGFVIGPGPCPDCGTPEEVLS